MVAYGPKKIDIHSEAKQEDKVTNGDDGLDQPGLFPDDLVQQWLSFSYIQHFSRHSFHHVVQVLCKFASCSANTSPQDIYNSLEQTFNQAKRSMESMLLWGYTIDQLGSRCGLVLGVIFIIWSVIAIVNLIFKMFMFKSKDMPIGTRCCMTMCTGNFLAADFAQKD